MANQYSAPSTSFGLPQTLRLPEEQKHINVITFSEDGTFLAVATGGDSNSGCLTIWEVSERVSRLRQAQSIGFNSPVRAAAWCGGSAISVGLANGQIWDISSATGNISEDTEPIFRMTAPIHNIAYDSASKRVLVGSGRQVILANWPTLWIKSNAVESTTVDDVPVEVTFHSTSGSCFIAWLKEGVQVYAHGVNDNHEVFLDKLWSFTYTGLSSGISLSENHLVVKTLFNGLLWFDIETHDLIHTSPGWALGPAPEQQLTPVQFLGTDEVATGTDTGQILILKMDSNKPTSTLDLHGARPQALAFKSDKPLLIVGTSDELGATLYGFDQFHDTVRSFYFYRVGSFCPWFPVGVVAGIVFIGGVVAVDPAIYKLFRLVTGFHQTSTQVSAAHQGVNWVQTCVGFSLGVVTGAFLSGLIRSRFAHAQGETAGLVKVKGDHDSVVPESDNPWDNSGDRQHDTYDTATQSLDPQVMEQPGHLHGTLAHTRDSDHDQDRDREHSESEEEEEEEKSEVPTGWQDVPAQPDHA